MCKHLGIEENWLLEEDEEEESRGDGCVSRSCLHVAFSLLVRTLTYIRECYNNCIHRKFFQILNAVMPEGPKITAILFLCAVDNEICKIFAILHQGNTILRLGFNL